MERYFFCKTDSGFEPALPVKTSSYRDDSHLRDFWNKVTLDVGFAPVAELQAIVNCYTGGKRKIYHNAMLEYFAFGVSKKNAMLKSFVKFEKQNLDKAPRVINPRTPIYNLLLGAYIKCLEKQFFKSINKAFKSQTTHTVVKGIDNIQAANVLHQKWNRFSNPVAIGLDATKFDMHVSRTALEYEHLFYLKVHSTQRNEFSELWDRYHRYNSSKTDDAPLVHPSRVKNGTRPLLWWLLAQQLDNQGKAHFPDGKLRFKMRGTRSSGDMNTSLGNCIIMCGLIYAWTQRVGVQCELANNGDDCVVILEQDDLAKFSHGVEDYFTQKGFRMQIEKPVYEFEEIEFCQSHPVYDGEQFKMIRNVDTAMIKNAMCLVPIANKKSYQKWLGAVGLCEGVLCSGIPIMQEFAATYRRLGCRVSKKYVQNMMRNTGRAINNDLSRDKLRMVPVSDKSRLSFYKAFGILPDHQVAVETHLKSYSLCYDTTIVVDTDAALKPHFYVPPVMQLVDPANLTW